MFNQARFPLINNLTKKVRLYALEFKNRMLGGLPLHKSPSRQTTLLLLIFGASIVRAFCLIDSHTRQTTKADSGR